MNRADRTFSFECFPAERTGLLAGMIAGPAITFATLYHYQAVAKQTAIEMGTAYHLGQSGKLLAAGTIIVTLALVLFTVVYLQYRAKTKAVFNEEGLRFQREGFLPFGLLEKLVFLCWSDIDSIEYRISRRTLFAQPVLDVRSGHEQLTLSVADAWDESCPGKKPWMAKPPKGAEGWIEAEIVKEIQARTSITLAH